MLRFYKPHPFFSTLNKHSYSDKYLALGVSGLETRRLEPPPFGGHPGGGELRELKSPFFTIRTLE